MRHLRKYNESNQNDDLNNIKEILQSWLDDFDFDIIQHSDSDRWDGIFYHISTEKHQTHAIVEISITVNGIDNYINEYKQIKERIGELVDHFKSNYDYVDYENHSRYVSWDQKYLVISITI